MSDFPHNRRRFLSCFPDRPTARLRADCAAAPRSPAAAAQPNEGAPMSAADRTPQRPVILIVEDRAVMRAMLREFVQRAFPEYDIMDAHNGARGLALCME